MRLTSSTEQSSFRKEVSVSVFLSPVSISARRRVGKTIRNSSGLVWLTSLKVTRLLRLRLAIFSSFLVHICPNADNFPSFLVDYEASSTEVALFVPQLRFSCSRNSETNYFHCSTSIDALALISFGQSTCALIKFTNLPTFICRSISSVIEALPSTASAFANN